ncbi:MAG: sulfatase [Planctomycetes bacterium]|nr:sulfatase [Planctomycetota bacterium]
MNKSSRFLFQTARHVALAGFVVGGIYAVSDIWSREYVREFQAGASSPFLERMSALAQRAAVEGVGFGLLALFLAALALPVGMFAKRRFRSRHADDSVGAVECASNVFFLGAAAFVILVTVGTWLGNEFVAFLDVPRSLLLNVGGFAALFIILLIFGAIVQMLPMSARRVPAACGIAAGAAAGAAVWVFTVLLLKSGGGWREPLRLGATGVAILASFPVGSWLSSVIEPAVGAIGDRISRGRLLPRIVYLILEIGLAICTVVSIIQFDFSAARGDAHYKTLPGRGKNGGPNVILITIDTLRADHLGCYGYKRTTTPFLDSIAADGTRFADASAAATWTKPSTATILTGLYPSRHGALYHGSSLNTPENKKTLAETFQEKGFVTAGFVSNPNVKKIFKFDRGFDEFFDSPVEDTLTQAAFRDSIFGGVLKELTRYQFNWKYQNDCVEINRNALAWLDANHAEKFFLYLHYIDPHEPYSPPDAYEKQFAQNRGMVLHNERKRLVGVDLYDGEIRYTDDNLKILSDRLRSHGILDNTIIIVTSDHGEEFFEHGTLGHGFSLYQEVAHVPLLMRGPGIPKGAVLNNPVSLVDLAATVLDVAGTSITELGDGKSLAPLLKQADYKTRDKLFLEDEFGENENDIRSFVMNGIRVGPWKLILNERNAYRPPEDPKYGREELYNLESDPSEKKNIFHDDKHRDVIIKFLEELQKHASFLADKGLRSIPPAVLSPEIRAELKRIGYLK